MQMCCFYPIPDLLNTLCVWVCVWLCALPTCLFPVLYSPCPSVYLMVGHVDDLAVHHWSGLSVQFRLCHLEFQAFDGGQSVIDHPVTVWKHYSETWLVGVQRDVQRATSTSIKHPEKLCSRLRFLTFLLWRVTVWSTPGGLTCALPVCFLVRANPNGTLSAPALICFPWPSYWHSYRENHTEGFVTVVNEHTVKDNFTIKTHGFKRVEKGMHWCGRGDDSDWWS